LLSEGSTAAVVSGPAATNQELRDSNPALVHGELLACPDLYVSHGPGDCRESTSALRSPLKSPMTSGLKSESLVLSTSHVLLPSHDTSHWPLTLRAMSVNPSPSKSANVSCDSGIDRTLEEVNLLIRDGPHRGIDAFREVIGKAGPIADNGLGIARVNVPSVVRVDADVLVAPKEVDPRVLIAP
jgi:hypothetical protein